MHSKVRVLEAVVLIQAPAPLKCSWANLAQSPISKWVEMMKKFKTLKHK